MINFKIISTKDLPDSDGTGSSDHYIKVKLQNFDYPTSSTILKTRVKKETLNPEWNQEISIPFFLFNSLELEIWKSNTILNDSILCWANIHPSFEEIYQNNNKQKTINLTLNETSKTKANSICNYLFTPIFSGFEQQPNENPEQVFAYLSFDPPKKTPFQHDVQLLVYGVNKNGTIFDACTDIYTRGDKETFHFGPTGPTQVFYFDRSNLSDDKYFFIVKSGNFTGKLTLNFLAGSKNNQKNKYLNYKIFDQLSFDIVNDNEDMEFILTFPIILVFTQDQVKIEKIPLPDQIISQKVPLISSTQKVENSDAIIGIINTFGEKICPAKKTIHFRFEIYPGNKYSLDDTFNQFNINHKPDKIIIGLGSDPKTVFDISILPICDNGKYLDPICYSNQYNSKKTIKILDHISSRTAFGDSKQIFMNFSKFSHRIKYMALIITSSQPSILSKINRAFYRIFDYDTSQEVMYMSISKKEEKSGLLLGVLEKKDENWLIWPCLQFFDGKNTKDAMEFFNIYIKS